MIVLLSSLVEEAGKTLASWSGEYCFVKAFTSQNTDKILCNDGHISL